MRRAAGPRGGDFGWSLKFDRDCSLEIPGRDIPAGDCPREGSGERSRRELGRGEARFEAGSEFIAEETCESRGGERLKLRKRSPRRLGERLALQDASRMGGVRSAGERSRRSRFMGDRERLLSSRLSSRRSNSRSRDLSLSLQSRSRIGPSSLSRRSISRSLSLSPQSLLGGGERGLSNRSPRPTGENLLGVGLLLGLRRMGDLRALTGGGGGLRLRSGLLLGLSLERSLRSLL